MAGRRKFEKLEYNENYYANSDEKIPTPEKKRTIEKKESGDSKKKGLSFAKLFEKSPEPASPSTRFTYSKIKRVGGYKKKNAAVEVKAPSRAVFFLMSGVFVLMLLAKIIVSEKMLSQFSQDKAALADTIVNIAVFLVPILVYILSAPERKAKYYMKKFSASAIPFASAMLLFVICFTALQKYYITYNYMYSVEVGTASKNVFLILLTGAVLPAVFEQAFVHGVFQYEITKYAGGFCGVCVSALVFALLQFDLRYFLIYLFIGIVMGSVTHVSGSVFPAMAVRFLSCSMSIFLSDRITFVAQERIGGTLLMIILAALSFVFLITALRIAERISNKRAVEHLKHTKTGGDSETNAHPCENGGETDEKPSIKEDENLFFVAKEGHTAARFGKVIFSPYLLVPIAVFVIALILK